MSHKKELNLIPLPRELHFDDTFMKVNAVMRFDTKIENSDFKIQILIDLRHKKDKWKSKPHFYGTMSQPRQFEDLVTASLAMTCFHRLRSYAKLTRDQILACYDEIVNWTRDDVAALTAIMFRDVKAKVKE